MRITKLEYQKKTPDRVSVYVDDKFAVGLDVNDVIKLGIANNQEISQDQLNKLIENSNFGKAFNAALNFLSFRPRSEMEIRQYLKRRKAEDIDGVLEKLKQIGQVNDEAFTLWWIEQRNTFRPKGKRLVEMELRRKGIPSNTIKQLHSNENQEELAMKAIRKKLPMPSEKIFRFLASRGFDYEIIEKVIAKIGRQE